MKDLKISKELFNEVTNSDCHEVFIKDEFIIAHSNLGMKMVNLYEFAFIKCKEWAKNKEYIIHSSPTQKVEYTAIVQSFDINKFYYGQNQFYALSEVEAIIKACTYILNNLSNK